MNQTLNARKVPILQGGGVQVISQETGRIIATFPSWHSSKPDYRHRYVMINCYRYRLNWLREALTA